MYEAFKCKKCGTEQERATNARLCSVKKCRGGLIPVRVIENERRHRRERSKISAFKVIHSSDVEMTLGNGVTVFVSIGPDAVAVSFGGIGENRIGVETRSDNGLRISYKPAEEP